MEKNGHVYDEIRKMMYGLQQAGYIKQLPYEKIFHHMGTISVGTHLNYGGTNGDQ